MNQHIFYCKIEYMIHEISANHFKTTVVHTKTLKHVFGASVSYRLWSVDETESASHHFRKSTNYKGKSLAWMWSFCTVL